jgi:hypothetical protein
LTVVLLLLLLLTKKKRKALSQPSRSRSQVAISRAQGSCLRCNSRPQKTRKSLKLLGLATQIPALRLVTPTKALVVLAVVATATHPPRSRSEALLVQLAQRHSRMLTDPTKDSTTAAKQDRTAQAMILLTVLAT